VSRILVTGASGWIGRRALGPLLERGFEVHALARQSPAEGDGRVVWHAADLLDSDARGAVVAHVRPSHLLHLAWYVEPGSFWSAPENAAWVAATIGLVERFAAAGGERAVLAGTCAEYDWEEVAGPLREDSQLVPATFYGVCKDAAGRVAEGLGERVGVAVARGRVFHLYGPEEDERRLVAGVARSLLAGERVATSDGEQVRDFLHVDDVAGAFAALAAASGVAGAVNIGSGAGVTVRQVIELVAESAGRRDLLDIGALERRPGEPPELVPDVTRLRDEVGCVPAIELADGLAATVAWWRERVA
jgi:nucleoside-diphosphate-sugar epimerase